MQVFRRAPPVALRRPSAVTIGNFDGVHRGHQALLLQLAQQAALRSLPTCVLTFEPHPREYFARLGRGTAPARVCSLRDKLDALAEHRVQRVNIAHFNLQLASMSAERFIDEVLLTALQTRFLLIGDDFRFGAGRTGDLDLLMAQGQAKGFEVQAMPTVNDAQGRISSSAVRQALAAGALDVAQSLLGRPFTLSGHVTHGRKLGRTLGFPTLNIRLPFRQPALSGIFAVRIHGLGLAVRDGVASLGTRPAVEANGAFLLEVNVFDFDQSVYGKLVQIEFVSKLRDEANYENLELLKQQIAQDAGDARQRLKRLSS
jgi:riboflavin kinase / FMN adenylyltransferase